MVVERALVFALVLVFAFSFVLAFAFVFALMFSCVLSLESGLAGGGSPAHSQASPGSRMPFPHVDEYRENAASEVGWRLRVMGGCQVRVEEGWRLRGVGGWRLRVMAVTSRGRTLRTKEGVGYELGEGVGYVTSGHE